MNKKTRLLTLTALLAALTVVLLYIASMLPTARIWVTAAAGLMTAAAVIECGIPSGIACFVISSLLSGLLLPVKSIAAVYIIFFGIYPVIKSLAERAKSRAFEWAVKLVFFNASFTALYLLWRYGFLGNIQIKYMALLIYLVGNAGFIIYDIAFSKLVEFYLARIYRNR